MPTLFISYKRDDKVAVLKIVDRLKKDFYFDIWIDAVSIPGGEDWRAEIRKGIDKADVVLLMLTPDACASVQVKEEIDYAKSVNRKIIPLQIKRVSNDDLEKLGVEHLNYIDFVSSHDDRFAWEKLINDLPLVLERDKRLLDPKFKALHQEYLRSLFTRFGKLSLSYLLDATPKERVSLSEVYVPLFFGTLLWGEVNDGELVDWWVSDSRTIKLEKEQRTQKFDGLVVDPFVLGSLVERMRSFASKQGISNGEYSLWRLESEEAPALTKHLVITGAPGSGKSTLLKHLSLCMAGDMLFEGDEAEADLNQLGFWPLPAYTPVFVELRALVRSAFPDPQDEVTLEKFFAYIDAEQLKPHGISPYLDDLRAQLRDGDGMIFLDGLDEVPEAETKERREQIKALAHLLSQQYPTCRICVTSRPYAYAGDWQLDGFGQVTLIDLDADRLEELALRLFRAVQGQSGAEQEAEAFKKQMKKVPSELRGSPLFFTLMAAIWLNNLQRPAEQRLPVSRGDIYRESVEMLIRRWTRKDAEKGHSTLDDIGLDERQLRQVLQVLAYQVHSETGDSDDAEFTGGQILDTVELLKLWRVDIYGLRDALAQRAGVIYERAPNRYQYAHRSFQEHLAACHLAEEAHYPQKIVQHLSEQPGLWRNVMELLPDEARRQNRDLWRLVKALLPEKDAPLPTTADDALWMRVYHAARLMTQHLPASDDLQDLYRPRLKQLILKLIELGVLAPVERAEMGRLLSEFGDPRPGVGLREDGLPDIEWVDIPAGEYTYHDGKKTLDYDFQISRYPITYKQFQAFLDDPEGYNDPKGRWFEGLAARENDKQMEDQVFKYANHPRERVNWYQAIAFCRWMSWRLDALTPTSLRDAPSPSGRGAYDPMNPSTWGVRLPTEFEWEKAARANTGWVYPYGNDFDAAKGNTRETGIGQTSAVGIFPSGDAPHWSTPISDLSGNVWEWCLTDYNNPAEKAQDENMRSNTRRVLRGGSWFYLDDAARAVYRDYFSPNYRSDSSGFRLVRAPQAG